MTSNVPRPTTEELHSLKSLAQWNETVGRYGEKMNAERKAKEEAEIRLSIQRQAMQFALGLPRSAAPASLVLSNV